MKKVCVQCEYVGKEISHTKGSIAIEIILWLMFLLPGFLYSVWRLTTREKVCPCCFKNKMIPVDSVHGKRIMESYK